MEMKVNLGKDSYPIYIQFLIIKCFHIMAKR